MSIPSIFFFCREEKDFVIDIDDSLNGKLEVGKRNLITRIQKVISVLAEIHSVGAAIEFVFAATYFAAAKLVFAKTVEVFAIDV